MKLSPWTLLEQRTRIADFVKLLLSSLADRIGTNTSHLRIKLQLDFHILFFIFLQEVQMKYLPGDMCVFRVYTKYMKENTLKRINLKM